MKSRRELIALSKRNSDFIKRKRRRTLFRLVAVLALVFLAGGAAIWGVRQDAVRVHRVTVKGNTVLSSEALTALVEQSLAGVYVFLVPKDTVLFYPRKAIIAAALETYPRIETADIATQNFDTLVLSIKERVPQFVWCGHSSVVKDIADRAPCYFADGSGYIFDRAPSFSNPVFFEVTSPLVNAFGSPRSGDPIGNFVLSSEELRKIALFKDRLSVAGIETASLRVLPGGDYELRMKTGGKIIFNSKQNFDTVLENLSAALRVSDLNKAIDGASLQYIDLRFGNKVFYKLN